MLSSFTNDIFSIELRIGLNGGAAIEVHGEDDEGALRPFTSVAAPAADLAAKALIAVSGEEGIRGLAARELKVTVVVEEHVPGRREVSTV